MHVRVAKGVSFLERKIRKPRTRESRPERRSNGPSAPAESKVRPEDVVFHDVDHLGGIIITGTRKQKAERKPDLRLDD